MSIEELYNIFEHCKKKRIYVQLDEMAMRSDEVPSKEIIDNFVGLIFCLTYKDEVLDSLKEEGSAFISYRILGFYNNGKEIHDYLLNLLNDDFNVFTGKIYFNKELNIQEYNLDVLLEEEYDCNYSPSNSSNCYSTLSSSIDDSFLCNTDSSECDEEEQIKKNKKTDNQSLNINILIDNFIKFIKDSKFTVKDLTNFNDIWMKFLKQNTQKISFTDYQSIDLNAVEDYVILNLNRDIMENNQDKLVENEYLIEFRKEVIEYNEDVIGVNEDKEEDIVEITEGVVDDNEDVAVNNDGKNVDEDNDENVEEDNEDVAENDKYNDENVEEDDEEDNDENDDEDKYNNENVEEDNEDEEDKDENDDENNEDVVENEENNDENVIGDNIDVIENKEEGMEDKDKYYVELKLKKKKELLAIANRDFQINKWLDKNIRFHNKRDIIDAILNHKYRI